MTGTVVHLSNEELEARFRAAGDVVERTHFQAILLLGKGRSTRETAEILALSERWVEKLAERYGAMAPRRLAISGEGIRARGRFWRRKTSRLCASACGRPLTTAASGAVRRWRFGSRRVSGLSMCIRRAVGKR